MRDMRCDKKAPVHPCRPALRGAVSSIIAAVLAAALCLPVSGCAERAAISDAPATAEPLATTAPLETAAPTQAVETAAPVEPVQTAPKPSPNKTATPVTPKPPTLPPSQVSDPIMKNKSVEFMVGMFRPLEYAMEYTDVVGACYGEFDLGFKGTFEPQEGMTVPVELSVRRSESGVSTKLTIGKAELDLLRDPSGSYSDLDVATVDIDLNDGMKELMIAYCADGTGYGEYVAMFFRYDAEAKKVISLGKVTVWPAKFDNGMTDPYIYVNSDWSASSIRQMMLYTDGCGRLVAASDMIGVFSPAVALYSYCLRDGRLVCEPYMTSFTGVRFTTVKCQVCFIEREYSPDFYSDSGFDLDDGIMYLDIYEVLGHPTHLKAGQPIRVLYHDRYDVTGDDIGDFYDSDAVVRWMYVDIGGRMGYVIAEFDFVG